MLSKEPPVVADSEAPVCCIEGVKGLTGLVGAVGVLWTLKSDRDAISLSSSRVADVAEGFTGPAEDESHFGDLSSLFVVGNWAKISSVMLNCVALSSCSK